MTRFVLRACCLAAGLTGAVAANAAPIEFVNVSATIAGAIGGGGNTLTYSSLTGLSSQGQVLPPSVLTQVFSPDPAVPDATAAQVAVSGTLVNGSQTYNTAGSASADLSTGSLGVLGSSNMISGGGTPVNGLGRGTATIRDEVTFSNTTGAGVAIDVFFTLSGTQFVGENGSVGETLRFCLGFNCQLAGNSLISNAFEYMFFHNSAFLPNGNYVTKPTTGWISTEFTPGDDPTNEVFHGVYLVPAGESTVDLFARLSIDCRFDAACDYGHTGTLSFGLAPGVTFNSTSGVLLSATGPSPVPEPATLPLFALGALALRFLAKRKAGSDLRSDA